MSGLLSVAMIATLQITHVYPGAQDRATEIDLTPASATHELSVRYATSQNDKVSETVRSYGPSLQKDLEAIAETSDLLDLKTWKDDAPCRAGSEIWRLRANGQEKSICKDATSKRRLSKLALAVTMLLKD